MQSPALVSTNVSSIDNIDYIGVGGAGYLTAVALERSENYLNDTEW